MELIEYHKHNGQEVGNTNKSNYNPMLVYEDSTISVGQLNQLRRTPKTSIEEKILLKIIDGVEWIFNRIKCEMKKIDMIQNKNKSSSGIIVVGSLNPEKECQDRVRILGGGVIVNHYVQQTTKTHPKY